MLNIIVCSRTAHIFASICIHYVLEIYHVACEYSYYLDSFSMSCLCDSDSHMQAICSGLKLLLLQERVNPPRLLTLLPRLAELQVDR